MLACAMCVGRASTLREPSEPPHTAERAMLLLLRRICRSESLPGCGPSMPHFPCSFSCSELGGWGRTWAATHMSRDAHGSGACSLCHYDAGDCVCYVTLCLRAHLRARRPYEKSGRGYKSVVTCPGSGHFPVASKPQRPCARIGGLLQCGIVEETKTQVALGETPTGKQLHYPLYGEKTRFGPKAAARPVSNSRASQVPSLGWQLSKGPFQVLRYTTRTF